MESKSNLLKAVFEGDTNRFLEIHTNNPMLLNRFLTGCSIETPLHVAALKGNFDLVETILQLCPDLAESLDSSRSSPLHLAVAKGCLDIVKILVLKKPEMCNGLNQAGLSPAHLAVIKGRVEVVKELVRGSWAKVRTNQEETVLHLCVKHCQLEILKMLIDSVDDVQDLVNATDVYGYTILHVAVSERHVKIVDYLITTGKVDINARNANGNTPLDVLNQSRRDVHDWYIANSIQKAGALKGTSFTSRTNTSEAPKNRINSPISSSGPSTLVASQNEITPISPSREAPQNGINSRTLFSRYNTLERSQNGNDSSIFSEVLRNPRSGRKRRQNEWLSKKRDALMVVASLLAAMAFQVGVNPPGGVWQDDSKGDPLPKNAHRVGEAVIAYNYPDTYKFYLRFNTVSFVASLSTILLLISGLPFKQRTFMWILMGIMWVSISTMAFTYGYAIVAVTPKKDRKALRRTLYVAIPVWCGITALLFLGHLMRLISTVLKKKGIDVWKYMKRAGTEPGLPYMRG